jgi:hypothetical protein
MLSISATRRASHRLLKTTASYTSRAHPKRIPDHPVGEAINKVLEDIEQRKAKRANKWERNAPKRREKGLQVKRLQSVCTCCTFVRSHIHTFTG